MELLIKLYKDKAPRMGVVYPNSWQAEKAFQPIMDKHKGDEFRAQIELSKLDARLTLTSVQDGSRIKYDRLRYHIEQLRRFRDLVQPGTRTEFVHVYRQVDQVLIAKVRFKNPVPLVVTQWEIYNR
ncbi:MAG: hypothetical protein AB1458_15655 [Bacteroidota bacterium]